MSGMNTRLALCTVALTMALFVAPAHADEQHHPKSADAGATASTAEPDAPPPTQQAIEPDVSHGALDSAPRMECPTMKDGKMPSGDMKPCPMMHDDKVGTPAPEQETHQTEGAREPAASEDDH